MGQFTTQTSHIKLRALDSQRALIDRATSLQGKNRADFMLETVCREVYFRDSLNIITPNIPANDIFSLAGRATDGLALTSA